MYTAKTLKIVEQIDSIHRELARISVSRRLGTPYARTGSDVLELHPLPVKTRTRELLTSEMEAALDPEEKERLQRILFGCMELVIEQETSSLADMLSFYTQGGRMHIGKEKVPAPEVVPWLQTQPDFDKRETMRQECSIYFKAISNHFLTGMLELTIKAVKERFGFKDYADYCQTKKQVSFEDYARVFEKYLKDTDALYRERMNPWVEEKIGRPFSDLSRYHALYLVRIQRFDRFFDDSSLQRLVEHTFRPMDFDLFHRSDVIVDISDHPAKSPDGICVGVEVPGQVHVLVKPVGGLADVEALLHEAGHAFFLSHFDPNLPLEYRRLYRSAALDETFAILFMELVGNPCWLTRVAELPDSDAQRLADIYQTKRLCLIRRHIGKFLAEKEFFESGELKDSGPYCRRLNEATGFVYEPQGYLVDMETEFYALEYLRAWAGADALQQWLAANFGEAWFENSSAGDFLKSVAAKGRTSSLEDVLHNHCEIVPSLPQFPAP